MTEQSSDTVEFHSREPFEQLGFQDAPHDVVDGTSNADTLVGDPRDTDDLADLPGALAFWAFDDASNGEFSDSREGPVATAYNLVEGQAVLATSVATRNGPDGVANSALEFDGETSFGFIEHHSDLGVTQGTVATWIQPDNLSHDAIILSKDQSGPANGGHFRLGHEDDGRIFIRFAEGDGGSNNSWVSSKAYFQEGVWTHVAVSFTADGVTVYADGAPIPDFGWYRQEGNLDSPAHATEAYLLQNAEPWILGADTSGIHNNESPAEFAAETGHLCDPFDGAIADFGVWGGFSPEDALDSAQVFDLFTNGPGSALTNPNDAQAILAGDDILNGGDGNDVLDANGGDDILNGEGGDDTLDGGYGDDILEGGDGNDVLEGGRGSDLLIGGDGDDLLVGRSDSGEQRIGQLAIGQPTREDPDNEVNPERQKLYGWEDQPLIGDDIMVGGEGRDTFLFNPQINAKRDIILEHVNDDRSIDWAGVAGENNELHDHWVDSFGIDVIADYNAAEDTIAIIGHTVNPVVEHKLIDTENGVEAISVITVYSNQGGGGGAHTQDLIGQIVVRGDLVDQDAIVREAGVTHGIVDTIDDLQQALAPTGMLKTTIDPDTGEKIFGYDTRDAEGNLGLVTSNPENFIDNPFLDSDRFDFAGNVPEGVPAPVAVIDDVSHSVLGDPIELSGNGDDGEGNAFVNIAHVPGLAQTTGTFAFNFTADTPGAGKQTLFSKDASGYVTGGHLTAWITEQRDLLVRYQSTDETRYLKANDFDVEAGQKYHFAFTFDGTKATLYVDGQQRDVENLSESPNFAQGMFGNMESLVLGADVTSRSSGELNNLKRFFDGTIEDVVVADRALFPTEMFKLTEAGGNFDAIGLDSSNPPNTPPDQDLPDPGDPASAEAEAADAESTPIASQFVPIDGTDGDDQPLQGTDGNDVINGLKGDDHIVGNDGIDTLRGGYGDDKIEGGDGNDFLDGGRGSDLLLGGLGDDLLLSDSDAGEQRIGQLAIGEPTRGDPDGEVDADRQKLTAYLDQPLIGDDIMVGGEGKDTFLFTPLINGKAEILERNMRSDGSIDWTMHGVAGENNELHDHWVDSFGIDVIADYNAAEDHIAVIGHTANIAVEHRDLDGDDVDESIITVYSQQGGGGGAHTQDLIGQIVVHGDKVDAEEVVTDAGVFYGIVDNISDVDQALNPDGDLKVTNINGEDVFGYDTRDANGNLGPVTANPQDFVDNPYLDEVTFANESEQGISFASRAPFEPLEFTDAPDDVMNGTAGADVMLGDPEPADTGGIPAPLAFWSFSNGVDGVFADATGGPQAVAYTLFENQALLQVEPQTRPGPFGEPALEFDGKKTFGFIEHDSDFEITQGTIALWVQPDDLDDDEIILSKDQSGTGDGGHFRLGHEDDGRIFIRFAEGDGGSNKAWISSKAYFQEGVWTHVAVSFTADGITVYADGAPIPDFGWYRQEGNLDSPAQATEAYLLQNAEPWILGADTSRTQHNDTAAEFATDDEHLDDPFDGAIADFGIWGGFTPEDALNAEQVSDLFFNGPGNLLTSAVDSPSILAGDDILNGGDGNDVLDANGGNDILDGEGGDDTLEGGYGDDILEGGDGDDVLDGGRGSDLLIGGDGDDLLVGRSDSGEQRIGQLAIGEPTREDPDNEVNPERQKLYGWEDQPLIGDDIMVGGEGRDTFLFNPQINAKRDIILEHVNDDRSIDWAGVAGENNELHDHWVDSFGIDVIADYNAAEDTIAIIGHTVNPVVEHKLIDTTGDGQLNEAISIITVYSNQGGGGGAHTQDLIGQIVVRGDLVDQDAIVREAGVTHGIVDTVDDLQEALAPTGMLKTTIDPDTGEKIFGYDTRDAEGNLGLVTSNPQDFIDNPFLDSDRFDFAGNVPDGVAAPVAVIDALSHPLLGEMNFTGNGDDGESSGAAPGAFLNLAHVAGLAQTTGTVAFNFTADSPGQGKQTLFSKDASGYVTGGHLTAWITENRDILVRYQSTDETRYLGAYDVDVEAGQEYHFAFTFDGTSAALYVDGVQRDVEDLSNNPTFLGGMTGNTESFVIGADATSRTSQGLNNLKRFFDGEIEDVVVLDRDLFPVEVFMLAEDALAVVDTNGEPPPAQDPAEQDPPAQDPVEQDPPAQDPAEQDPPAQDPAEQDPPAQDPAEQDPPAQDPAEQDPPAQDPAEQDPPAQDPAEQDPPAQDPAEQDPPAQDPAEQDPPAQDITMVGTNANDNMEGGGGNDRISGKRGNDTIAGHAGDDTIKGGSGNDKLSGGDGDDTVNAGSGDDTVTGGSGNDEIAGGKGDDELSGGEGADNISGSRGNDTIDGGEGNDNLSGGGGNDIVAGGAGDDTIKGGSGNDELSGGGGGDTVNAGSGDDTVTGGSGNDEIAGGKGDDELSGGDGDDEMFGSRGDDKLEGGAGNDDLTGGRGNDMFIFDSLDDGSHLGLDTIKDFRTGKDSIVVSDDLSVLLEAKTGFTEMTLKDGEEEVGKVQIFGNAVNESEDIDKVSGDDLL